MKPRTGKCARPKAHRGIRWGDNPPFSSLMRHIEFGFCSERDTFGNSPKTHTVTPKPLPSLEKLNDLFVCHADIGEISWRVPRRAGKDRFRKYAGHLNKSTGYRMIHINRGTYRIHRIIWKMVTGKDPVADIDHINCNPLDNRFSNLREATRRQNIWNKKRKTTQLKGITQIRPNRWHARIRINGKNAYLGTFPTPELAHEAYWRKAQEIHGPFARRD